MQLKLDDFKNSVPEKTRKIAQEDLFRIMREIHERHELPITPVTDALLFVYLEKWSKTKFRVLKSRLYQLQKLSGEQDISKDRRSLEFFAIAYLFFFQIGIMGKE